VIIQLCYFRVKSRWLLQAKYDLKQIQTLMGHADVRTTEIYVLDELDGKVKIPLDDF
jgi:site-specific recombinase XerC